LKVLPSDSRAGCTDINRNHELTRTSIDDRHDWDVRRRNREIGSG
jgi:hypothetical protein